ncbi:unnamed protein product [Pedinophyceae sp. YPF-701]|nr:unnamed protein product [Pedinophyceae sp. YPF-701]
MLTSTTDGNLPHAQEPCGLPPRPAAPGGSRYVPPALRNRVPTAESSSSLRDVDNTSESSERSETTEAPAQQCIRHGASSIVGGRAQNEDVTCSFADIFDASCDVAAPPDAPEWRGFYAVFDGHGGQEASQYCGEELAKALVSAPNFPADIEQALRDAFVRVDEGLREKYEARCLEVGEEEAARTGSGTTALACLVWGPDLWVANLGDSRAVLCCAKRAIPLSADHRPHENEAELARVEAAGGYVRDGYVCNHLATSRALGDWHYAMKREGIVSNSPDVVRHRLDPASDEFLVLASDGLWELFHSSSDDLGVRSQRAIELARGRLMQTYDAEACAQYLTGKAEDVFHASDNTSVIVVTLRDAPPRQANFRNSSFRRDGSHLALRAVELHAERLGQQGGLQRKGSVNEMPRGAPARRRVGASSLRESYTRSDQAAEEDAAVRSVGTGLDSSTVAESGGGESSDSDDEWDRAPPRHRSVASTPAPQDP